MSCKNNQLLWVSFGGPVNASTGHVRLSHHIPGWENTPISSLLRQNLAYRQRDNDANVAALGGIALALDKDVTVYVHHC